MFWKIKKIYRKKSESIERFATICANFSIFIGALGALFLFSVDQYRNYVRERDQKFNGTWEAGFEGCIDCPPEFYETRIKLDLSAFNGELGGILDLVAENEKKFPKLPKRISKEEREKRVLGAITNIIFSTLNVEGDAFFNSGKIKIWDYVDGKPSLYGIVKIRLKGNMLYWDLIEGHPKIPKHSVLFLVDAPHTNALEENKK